MGGDAGLGAIEESAKPTGKQEFTAAEVVRKFFPEVWLWEISYITDEYALYLLFFGTDKDCQAAVSSSAKD